MNHSTRVIFSTLLLLCFHTVGATEVRSTLADQQTINLTVYNAGLALIRDSRIIDINPPSSQIAIIDVSAQIMPQTVAISGLDVLEQNYDFDLLSPQALIEKNIGNTVRIARRSRDSGETLEWRKGTLLSNNGGVILKMEDGRLESLNNNAYYHLVYDEVPDNLRTRPTLSLLLKQQTRGTQQVEMTYLSNGLSWQSDYVMQLDTSETSASLDSWITLNNQSGTRYPNARLQLLAGDINIHKNQPAPMMAREIMMSAQADGGISQQALHGYHLYTVPHRTTINNNQSKQIKLFSAEQIPVIKRLEDRAYVDLQGINPHKSKPKQILTFNNEKPALGIPLPKGTIRVYANDASGNKQFIGEDGINHTAVNDELEIQLGKAFDISLQRKTLKVKKLSKKQTRVAREININNGSKKAQSVRVSEIMPSHNWSITQASWSHSRQSPSEARFEALIPAMQTLKITYDVLITYP